MKRILLLLLLISGAIYSQTYTMQTGTISTCSGTLYDSGGAAGNYGYNEYLQLTICPSTLGTYINIDFSSFVVDDDIWDYMVIYNGTGTGGKVIGTFAQFEGSPASCPDGITSSDPSGCITIIFNSDGINNYAGWAATISCLSVPGGSTLAGNAVCSGANPFCADVTGAFPNIEFPNVSDCDNVPTAPASIVATTCLNTVPNPAWYYLSISQAGNLNLEISQTTGPNGTGTGLDVDYALWGPFPNAGAACSGLTPGNLVGCSYSTATQESTLIPGAQVGQVYMMLITNYNGSPGFINLAQTGGTGLSNCLILCPFIAGNNPTCGASNGSFVVSNLDPNRNYTITYSDDGVPQSVSIITDAAGSTTIGGLDAGNYTNILVNVPGCTTPLSVTLVGTSTPVLTSLASTSPVCTGGNAVFTLTATPNSTVTYNINGGANQTVLINAAGNATVTVNSIGANTTLTASLIAVGACSAVISNTSTVSITSNPTLTSVANNSPVCSGSNAVFTLAGTPNATVTYNINGGASQTIILSASGTVTVTVNSITANTTLSATLIALASCSSPIINSSTVSITANPTLTSVANNSPVCSGSNAVFTLTGIPNATVTYDINGGASQTVLLDAAGIGTVTVNSISANTTLTATLIALASCASPILNTSTVSITSNPTLTSVANNSPVCSGSNAVFTLTGIPNAIVTYSIDGGAGQTVLLDAAGIGTVTVNSISANTTLSATMIALASCSSAILNTSTVSITSNPTLTSVANNSPVCSGSNAVFTLTGIPNAIVTYSIDGGASQTVLLDAAGIGTVTVNSITANTTLSATLIALASCSSAILNTSTVSITSNPTLTSVANNSPVCSGSNAVFTLTGIPNAIVTYSIDGGAGQTVLLDAAGIGTVTVNSISANTTLSATMIALASCSSAILNTSTVSITSNPTLTSVANNSPVCSGSNAVFTLTGIPDATVTYNIDGGASQTVLLDAAGIGTVTVNSITANTTLTATMIALASCASAILNTSTVSITSNPTLTSVANNSPVCSGSNAVFTLTGIPNATVTYTIDGGASQTVLLDAAGSGTVTVNAITANTTLSATLIALASCSSAILNTSTVSITANPTLTSVANNSPVCSGSNAVFTLTGIPNATVTYNINGGASQTVLLDAAGIGNVTVNAISANTTLSATLIALASCSSSILNTSTVSITSNPTLTSVANNSPVCSGSNAVFTLTGIPNAIVTYNIDGGASLTVLLDAAGIGTVTVNAITANTTLTATMIALASCSSPILNTSTVSITSNPTLTSVANNSPVCSGSNAVFTLTGIPNATVTYNIDGGASQTVLLDAAGIGTVTVNSITANTTLTATMIALASCSSAILHTSTVSITSNPTLTSVANNSPICSGSNAVFTLTGIPNATVTYNIDGGASQTVLLDAAGIGTVTVNSITANTTLTATMIALASCSSPILNTSTVSITANPTLTSVANNSPICSGSNAVFTLTGIPNAIVTYSIDGGASQTVLLDAAGIVTVTVNAIAANTTLTATMIALASCASPILNTSTVSITSNPTLTSIANNSPICSGSNAVFTLTGIPNAIVTYNIDGGASQTVLLDAAGIGTVTVNSITANTTLSATLIALASCSSAILNTSTVSITSNPTLTSVANNSPVCSGSNAVFTLTGIPNAIVTYNIDGGASQTVLLDAAGIGTVTVNSITANTTLTATMIALASCASPILNTSTVSITSNPTLTSVANNSPVCSGSNAVFTLTGIPNAIVTYSIDGGASQTVLLDAAGMGTVTVNAIAANTTLTATLIALASCSSPILNTSTVSITSNPTLTSVANNSPICSGSNSVFTLTGIPNATVTYNIDGGASQTVLLDAAGIGTVTVNSITANTTLTATMIALASCSSAILHTSTVSITSNPTLTSVANNSPICSGSNAVFTLTGIPNATVTYNIDGGASQTVLLDAAGIGTVTVNSITANTTLTATMISLASCSSPILNTSTVSITANPTLTSVANNSPICSGSNAVFTLTGIPNAIVTYSIDGGASQTVLLDAAGIVTVTVNAIAANTTLTATMIALASCASPILNTSTVSITSNPTLTSIANNSPICSGSNAVFTLTGIPNAIVTYNIDGGASQTVLLDAAGIGTVTVNSITANTTLSATLIALASCSSAILNTSTVSITSNPTLTSVANNSPVCSGSNAVFTLTGIPNAIVTYNIDGGASQTVLLDAAGIGTVTVNSITANTTLTATMIALASCASPILNTSTVSITSNPTLTSVANNSPVCSGSNAVFTLTGIPNAIVTYSIDGGASQTVLLDAAGMGTVTVNAIAANTTLTATLIALASCSSPILNTSTVSITSNPTLTSVANNSPICSGSNSVFTLTGIPNATVTYNIDGGASQTVLLDAAGIGTVTVNSITANTTLTATMIALASCSSPILNISTVSITSNPTLTSVANNSPVCSGSNAVFTLTGIPNATVTYNINGGASQTVLLDAAGIGTVTIISGTANTALTATQISLNGCSTALSVLSTVIVNPNPALISVTNNSPICSGGNAVFTISGTPNSTITYNIGAGADQNILLNAAGSVSVSINTVSSDVTLNVSHIVLGSCNTILSTPSTINVLPNPQLNSVTGVTPICAGTNADFTLSGTPNATVTYHIGNGPNQDIILGASGNNVVTIPGATANITITATLISLAGCPTIIADSATVIVTPLPTLTSLNGSTPICSGQTAIFTITGTPNATLTYSIDSTPPQNILLDSSGNAIVSVPGASSDVTLYAIAMTNSLSCSNVLIQNTVVTVTPIPTAVIGYPGSPFCSSFAGTQAITIAGTGAFTGGSFTASPAGLTIDPAGAVTPSTSIPGTYVVRYVIPASGGCPSVPISTSVTITTQPTATISYLGTPFCQNNSSIQNVIRNGTGAYLNGSYSATPGGLAINAATGAITPSLSTAGTYTVTYNTLSGGGCASIPASTQITITPLPTVTLNYPGSPFCTSLTALQIAAVGGTGSYSGGTFTAMPGGLTMNSTGSINPSASIPGIYTVTYQTIPFGGCPSISAFATVTINDPATASIRYPETSYCASVTVPQDVIIQGNGNFLGGNFSAAPAGLAINPVTGAINPSASASGTYAIIYNIPPSGGCSPAPVLTTVVINTVPTVMASAVLPICSEDSVSISLSGNVTAASYNWTVTQNGVTGASPGSGNFISQSLQTTSASQGTVTYTVTATSPRGCVGLPISIVVKVNPLPEPDLTNGIICVNPTIGITVRPYILNAGLNNSGYDFSWTLDGITIAGASDNTFEATEAGSYSVIAENTVTHCRSHPVSAGVTELFVAESMLISGSEYFSDNTFITITVAGAGPYQYQIDNGAYQSSNTFMNVSEGSHIIGVRDADGCTDIRQEFNIINYPKFFTPNGDGYNETWNIAGLKDQRTVIHIFDRYGKFLKQLSTDGTGWDGTFNGYELPSTDYWFTVDYTEKDVTKQFKAHFSLKR